MRFWIGFFVTSLSLIGVSLYGQEALDSSIDEGYIYVLSNKSMTGLIKIGISKREDPKIRVNELNKQTGVPTPFTVIQITRVTNANYVEKKIHEIFAKNRHDATKEFFEMSPEQAKLILNLIASPEIRANSKAEAQPKNK